MISKKKQEQINNIGIQQMMNVLKEYNPNKKNEVNGHHWYDDNPSTWREFETNFFDALTMLSTNIVNDVIKLLDNKKEKHEST